MRYDFEASETRTETKQSIVTERIPELLSGNDPRVWNP